MFVSPCLLYQKYNEKLCTCCNGTYYSNILNMTFLKSVLSLNLCLVIFIFCYFILNYLKYNFYMPSAWCIGTTWSFSRDCPKYSTTSLKIPRRKISAITTLSIAKFSCSYTLHRFPINGWKTSATKLRRRKHGIIGISAVDNRYGCRRTSFSWRMGCCIKQV